MRTSAQGVQPLIQLLAPLLQVTQLVALPLDHVRWCSLGKGTCELFLATSDKRKYLIELLLQACRLSIKVNQASQR
jgi:hypothetical protein